MLRFSSVISATVLKQARVCRADTCPHEWKELAVIGIRIGETADYRKCVCKLCGQIRYTKTARGIGTVPITEEEFNRHNF